MRIIIVVFIFALCDKFLASMLIEALSLECISDSWEVLTCLGTQEDKLNAIKGTLLLLIK